MTGETPDHADLRRQFEAMLSEMDVDDLRRLTAVTPTTSRPQLRKPRRSEPATYRLRVDLEAARPPIWRRLVVRSDVTLDVVHQVLQAAFGWTDSHLHRFSIGGDPFDPGSELFLCPFDVEEGEEDGTPASDVTLDETLAEPGDRLSYVYDYGDAWDLRIDLEAVLPLVDGAPIAVCVDGRRAAPPEDCGGRRNAEDLAEVVDDPAHFDVDEVNQALRDPFLALHEQGIGPFLVDLLGRLRGTLVGEDLLNCFTTPRPPVSESDQHAAVQPVLWLLDRVGDDGLPLTEAGYLKPDDVLALSSVVPNMADWIGSRNRENHAIPVLQFREALQRLGLMRKYKKRLVLTKLGARVRGDATAVWSLLAERLPVGKPDSMELPAGLLVLGYAVGGVPIGTSADRIAAALHDLGWRYADDAPVDTWAVYRSTDTARAILDNLGGERQGRAGHERAVSPTAAALAYDALRT